MSRTTISCTVTNARRLNNSRNGNPRYELATSRGPFKTAVDTSAAFNLEADFPTGMKLNVPAVLTLDGKNIIDWEIQK